MSDEALPIERAHESLGRALWVSGALLWGYVVLGELVVNLGFAEALAVPALFGVLVSSWVTVSKPLLDADRTGRAALVAAAGVSLFVACVLSSSVLFGSSRRSHFETATVLLCAVGIVAHGVGRRLVTLPARAGRTNGQRVITWVTRIVVGLFTVVALLSAVAHS